MNLPPVEQAIVDILIGEGLDIIDLPDVVLRIDRAVRPLIEAQTGELVAAKLEEVHASMKNNATPYDVGLLPYGAKIARKATRRD